VAEHRATCLVIAGDALTDRGQQFAACAWEPVQSYRNMVQSVLDSVIDFACRSAVACGWESGWESDFE